MKSPAISPDTGLALLPAEAAARMAHLPESVFFDSALENAGAISILASQPVEVLAGKSEVDWERLRAMLRARQSTANCDDGLPHGMAAGYVEYDGAFRFAFFDDLLVYRHADESWTKIGEPHLPSQVSAPARAPRPRFQPTMSCDHFCEMVRSAQRYISAGDIYQANLSHRFTAEWASNPWRFYECLRAVSPAPHAAFLRAGRRTILSSSPECFLRMSGRSISTRPIKGTRPRFRDGSADERSALELITSPKEIAELVMITDLERNDLGQICEFGSVRVRELLKLERFEQVFHLVSTVDGVLRAEVDHVTALRKCFPGGSISGAPKMRAREIIAELEPEPRGLYTGAIGYFGYNGESQFNIAIRTVVVEENAKCATAHFHVGAGIVADSDPQKEWEESLAKAAGILLAAERC